MNSVIIVHSCCLARSQTIVHQLELTVDKTETVISTYLMDLVDYQKKHYGIRGTLTFSIGYNQDEQVLEVTGMLCWWC